MPQQTVSKLIRNLGLGLAFCASTAFGAVGINKSFTPNSVIAGQVSTLTIVLLNPNAAPATGVSVTDALPANVVVANPLTVGINTCGFVVTATPGSSPIALSGGTIPGITGGVPGQCSLTINVVSSLPNTYLNTIPASAVSSSQGTNPQSAQATLVVSAPANITGSKAFAPTNVHGNGTASTLTITLTNPNAVALTTAAITDTLPVAVTIATPSNAATTCGAGVATASAPATSPATIALIGGTIPASGSCTISVQVIARNPNAFVNSNQTNTIPAGALTTAQGATSPAIAANINVQTGAQIAKSFSPNPVPAGGAASTMTLTINNFNNAILTPITFTDTWLVAGMSVSGVPATTCGGVLTNTANSVTLTGGSLGPAPSPGPGATSCTITVPVTATATTVNSIPASTPATSFGGVNYPAVSSTLVVSTITGSKAFTLPAVQTGATTMTITLNNISASAVTITTITDNLTTMGAGFTVPTAAVPGGTCGSTLTSPTPGTLITLTGGTIPANGSCTITLPVAISATAATGNRTNTIAVNGVVTSGGNNTTAITGVVNVQRALNVAKAFLPANVQAGTRSRATITLTRTGGAVALTNISLTDNLTTMGVGFVVATPANAVTTCAGGTLTATPGATSFTLTGGTLAGGAANTSCTIALDVQTPVGATVGNHTNAIPAASVTTAQGPTGGDTNAILVISAPTSVTVNKSFSPTTVAVNGTSVMSIQIRNNNVGAIALTGVGLTDNLPTGMVVANPPVPTTAGCGAPVVTAANNATTVTLSNASIAVNAICTVNVTVRALVSGNLINTIPASAVSSSQGVTNPLIGSATLAATGTVNLNVTKTNGVTSLTPGGATTYTIGVTNSGPNDVAGLVVNDPPPAGVTFGAWTCVASAGSTCGSGSGPISDTVTILNGGSITYTVPATIASSAVGSITNTATLVVPGSVINNGNSSASDTDTLTPVADLAITKTDGVATIVPGSPITYTIVASNNGPSDVTSATVADTLPATILGATWTCVGAGGGVCPASGSGSINALVNLPSGATAMFTVTGTVSPAATGSLANTATIAVPVGATDPVPANNSATDTDTLTPTADLVITKTDGVASIAPGSPITYTIVASNAGPSTASGAIVGDALPATILGATWTCVGAGGGSCPASGSGNINASVNLPPGGTATFTLTGTVSAAATGTLANTATISVPVGVTDPNPGNNSATDTDTLTPTADLSITKTDGVASTVPGSPITYTIVASNAGPSAVTGATVTDTVPAAILGATWTCAGAGGGTCPASGSGNISASVNLPVGATATFTLTGTVSAAATGTLANTATIAVPAGVTDPNPGNNSATDTDTLAAQVSLGVAKTDGSPTYSPGGSATYTVTVTNGGPSSATDMTVADSLPVGATLSANATCAANGTASCGTLTGTTGQTAFGTTGASIDAGAGNSLVFTVPVAFAAGMTSDPIINTATATDLASSGPGSSASGTDTDTRSAAVTLAVTKTDGASTYTPGGTATYTVTVANTDVSDALDVTVTDALPSGLTLTANAVCVANGTSSCGVVTGIAGQVSFGTTGARVDAGGANTIVFTVPVAFAAGMSANPLVNTASAIDIPTGATASGSDSDTLSANVTLAVTKTDGSATYTPGGTATYTVTIANTGVSDALNVTVSDGLPAGLTLSANATCVANGTSSCGTVTGTTGQTSFGATSALVNTGGGNTLVFTIPVAFAPGMTTDPLVNTATASDLASGNTANGSDSDTLSAAVTLGITKTDGSATYTPGGTATYTVTVSNTGLSDALDVTVSDPLPAGVTLSINASCVASGTSSCGTVTGTTGQTSFGATAARVNAGAGNALVFTVPVAFAAGMTTSPLINTATATDVASGITANGSDSDVLSANVTLALTKTDGSASYTPGGTATYTVTIANTSVSDALNVTVTDPLPAGVTLTANATCVANGTSSCGTVTGTIGQTAFGATLARVDAGGANTLVFMAPIAFAAGMTTTNPLVNTATAVDQASGASASGSDSDVLASNVTLAVTKTDGNATYTPGGTATYTVTVANTGVSDALDVTVSDPLPAGLTLTANATCVAGGTSSCGTVAGTTGATSFGATSARVSTGAGNALVFTAPVAFAAGMTTESARQHRDRVRPGKRRVRSGSDSDALAAASGLTVTKTDGSAIYTPGGGATYTIVVTNAGPSNATSITVTDNLPAGVTLSANATCIATGTASCGTLTGITGATSFGATGATMAAGAGNQLTFTLPVSFAASLTADPLVNTVTASDPASATVAASDSDNRSAMADVGILKTGPATLTPGAVITYALMITNSGPTSANGATFSDIVPPAILSVIASCGSAAGGAVCGAVTIAGNTVSGVVPVLPVGGSVVIAITGTVSGTGTVINTATVLPPAGTGDPTPANGSSSVSTVVAAGAIVQVPVDATWAIMLLMLAIGLLGARYAPLRRIRVRD